MIDLIKHIDISISAVLADSVSCSVFFTRWSLIKNPFSIIMFFFYKFWDHSSCFQFLTTIFTVSVSGIPFFFVSCILLIPYFCMDMTSRRCLSSGCCKSTVFTYIIANTFFCASRSFYYMLFIVMFCFWDLFGLCSTAATTCISLNSCFGAGSFFCNLSFIPCMTECGFGFYLFLLFTITSGTCICCNFWIITGLFLCDLSFIPRMS